jgi:hypothetical protein
MRARVRSYMSNCLQKTCVVVLSLSLSISPLMAQPISLNDRRVSVLQVNPAFRIQALNPASDWTPSFLLSRKYNARIFRMVTLVVVIGTAAGAGYAIQEHWEIIRAAFLKIHQALVLAVGYGVLQMAFSNNKKADYPALIQKLHKKAAEKSFVSFGVHSEVLHLMAGEAWSEEARPVWELLLGEVDDVPVDALARRLALGELMKVPKLPKPVMYAWMASAFRRTAGENNSSSTFVLVDSMVRGIKDEAWSEEARPVWELLLGEVDDVPVDALARRLALGELMKVPKLPKPVMYAWMAATLRRMAREDSPPSTSLLHDAILKVMTDEPWSEEAKPVWNLLLGEGDAPIDATARRLALGEFVKVPKLPKPVMYAWMAATLRRMARENSPPSTFLLHDAILKVMTDEPWSEEARPAWESLLGKGMRLDESAIVNALDAMTHGRLSNQYDTWALRLALRNSSALRYVVGEQPFYERIQEAAAAGNLAYFIQPLQDEQFNAELDRIHQERVQGAEGRIDGMPEARALADFWQNGICPTAPLLRLYFADPSAAPALMGQWAGLLQEFRAHERRFDRDDPLHADLGYSLLLNAIDHAQGYKGAGSPKLTYQAYRQFLTQAPEGLKPVNNERHRTELLYLAYEAWRFDAFVERLQHVIEAAGREVVVVENKSYGAVAISPVKDRLAGRRIKVFSTKIGSTESHHNPYIMRSGLFSDSELAYIVQHRPVLVMVDASTSVNDPSRSAAHYPDAYQGYRNTLIALHDLLGDAPDEILRRFNITTDFMNELRKQSAYVQFRDRLERLKLLEKRWKGTGGIAYWTPSQVPLQVREHKRGLGFNRAPSPLEPGSWNGQDLIIVEAAMEPEAVQHAAEQMSDSAASYVLEHTPRGFRHQAAYFDDTQHFLEFSIAIGPYGPDYSRVYGRAAEEEFARVAQAAGAGPIETPAPARFPYRIVYADFDGTLGRTLMPVHGSMAQIILRILEQGTEFIVVTGQSREQLEKNLLAPLLAALRVRPDVSPDVLRHLHLSTDFGAFAYDVRPDGSLHLLYNRWEDVLNDSQRRQTHAQVETWVRAQPGVSVENHDGVLTLSRVPDRDRHLAAWQKQLNREGLPVEIVPTGRTSMRFLPKDTSKAVATAYFEARWKEVDAASKLTIGNNYSTARISDVFMMIPGARNVSVDDAVVLIPGLEHIGKGYRGSYELFRRLLESREPHIVPMAIPPAAVYRSGSQSSDRKSLDQKQTAEHTERILQGISDRYQWGWSQQTVVILRKIIVPLWEQLKLLVPGAAIALVLWINPELISREVMAAVLSPGMLAYAVRFGLRHEESPRHNLKASVWSAISMAVYSAGIADLAVLYAGFAFIQIAYGLTPHISPVRSFAHRFLAAA